MSTVVFYYRRSEFTTASKFTIRSVFSTGGSFGFRIHPHLAFLDSSKYSPVILENSSRQTEEFTQLFRASLTLVTGTRTQRRQHKPHNCRKSLSEARAALKGTNLTVSCVFLWFPAKICGFLRKSAFPKCFVFLGKSESLQKSARICENLRLGSVCPLRFVPLSALRSCYLSGVD